MNASDREHIAAVINFFWGDATAEPHQVNDRAAEVAYEALEDAQSCSASMDLVPRPSGGKPGPAFIIQQLAKIGKRIVQGDSSIYESCRRHVSSRYRSQIEMALMGL